MSMFTLVISCLTTSNLPWFMNLTFQVPMTNLDSIIKSRDITLPTKVPWVNAVVFPVVMYGCESWTIKKAECQRIDGFELWCCRKFLRVPWTARRSNQSILKEISPECSLEGLMLKLKLQYFGHLMWRADSFEKILMLGKIEGRRRRGWQRMGWLDGITDSMDMGLGGLLWVGDGQGGLACCSPWGCRVGHNWVTELSDWYNIALYRIELYFRHLSYPQLVVGFALVPSIHSFWNYFSTDLQ